MFSFSLVYVVYILREEKIKLPRRWYMAETRFRYVFMGCFICNLLTLMAEEGLIQPIRTLPFFEDKSHIYVDSSRLAFFHAHTSEEKAPYISLVLQHISNTSRDAAARF